MQLGISPTANQLKRLHDELDFANAPGPQLDIALHALAFDFPVDHRLEFAQRLDGAEVQIAAIDERAKARQQRLPGVDIPCHGARLEHGVTLPLTPLILIVAVQHREAAHQRSTVAQRAQTHVHAKHEAVGRHGIQGSNQALAELGKILLMLEGFAPSLGFAFFGERKDQVDIGGEVQLARAQLAHAQHHQPLG